MSVNIVQEDDTDYDKRWSRKVPHGGATSWANDSGTGSSRDSSPRKDEELPEDGIPVIHDAEDDEEDGL